MTDVEYIEKRNKLVPQAVEHANKMCGSQHDNDMTKKEREIWAHEWNRSYHTKMNELAKAEGLCK